MRFASRLAGPSARKQRIGAWTSVLARPCRVAIAAAAALALVPPGALGATSRPATARSQSRALVTYTEEQGGVAFRLTSLVVSADRQATVRFERCEQRSHLSAGLWKRLKVALRQTNLHAVAGDHVSTTPGAEESTWVITVGHDTVRMASPSIPPELRAKLEPLLKVVGEVITGGERHMPQSCSSKRVTTSTG